MIRQMTDQVRQSSIKMCRLELTKGGEKSGTQSAAHDHFECMGWQGASSSSSLNSRLTSDGIALSRCTSTTGVTESHLVKISDLGRAALQHNQLDTGLSA
jgi:hypothetical protein